MSRKLSILSGVVAVVVILLLMVSCGGSTTTTSQPAATPSSSTPTSSSTAVSTINLKFAVYHATGTEEASLCQEFSNQVQTRTNGAVQIQLFAGGSLLTAPNMYDGIVNGIADIGEGACSYNSGKFPEVDLSTCPLSVQSPWIITHVLNDFYNQYKPAEYNSTHVLWMWENGPAVVMTAKKQVTTLDDLKGLKIRAQALTGDIANALGASAQSFAMADLYDGLSKGVVDGVLVDPSVLVSFKLGDVCKYVLDCSKAVGNAYTFYIVMNNDAWNKLPKDTQGIVTQIASEMVEKSAVAINREDIAGIDYAKKAGDVITTLSDAQIPLWQAAVASVADNYIAAITKDGKLSPDTERQHLKYLQDRVAYWTDQQTKQGTIPFPLK
jgi:TRAP-type C4-dicarboxylate transport system substrate-binding protein